MFTFIRQAMYRHKIRQLAKALLEHADIDEFYEKIQLRLQEEPKEEVIKNTITNYKPYTRNNYINDKYNNFGYYDK